MIRTSILSLATVVLAGALTNAAAPPELGVKEGFRVYTIAPRCGSYTLAGVYATPDAAFLAAAGLRANSSPARVEVTTGPEGAAIPGARSAALYEIYTRSCSRSQWRAQPMLYADEKKATEAADAFAKERKNVQIVRDFAPKEVYHVYALPCRTVSGTGSRLQGSYRTLEQAFAAADDIREKKSLRCEVTTGTKGRELLDGTPTQYTVYSRGCKGGLVSPTTTAERAEAVKDFQARTEQKSAPVMVVHYDPKEAPAVPMVSGIFDGKKRSLQQGEAGSVAVTVALVKSCSAHAEGTAADIAAARKGEHFRMAFAEPREFEVAGKKVRVTEVVMTLPVDKGVLWLRSGNKVLREAKFDPKKWTAFKAWLDSARAAG